MKNIIRISVLSSIVMTTMFGMAASTANAGDFNYQGFGGWRTFDQNRNPLPDASGDLGPAKSNITLSSCHQACKADSQCQGVEYVNHGGGNTVCEIHYDEYAYCDSRPGKGSRVNNGEDGCWVKNTCSTDDWKQITIRPKSTPGFSIRVDDASNNFLSLMLNAQGPLPDDVFEVDHHSNCLITLKYRQNGLYVKNDTVGHLQANATSITNAALYEVVENVEDNTYSFKDTSTQKWVYTTSSLLYNGKDNPPNILTHFAVWHEFK